MKSIRFLLSVAMFVSVATCAHASIHAVIVDPPVTPNVYELDPGDTAIPAVDFNFGMCSIGEKFELTGTGATAGCFEIENFTGKSITDITITFQGSPSVFGTDPTCGGLFGNVSCTETNGFYTLSFAGGAIPDGSDAIIGESLPVSDFSGISIGSTYYPAGYSATPEPDSLVLLGTGLVAIGRLAYTRRRGIVSNSPTL